MQNTLKCDEWRRTWVLENFKFEMQNGGPNNSEVLWNWFPQRN